MVDMSILDRIEDVGRKNMFGEIITTKVREVKPTDVKILKIGSREFDMSESAVKDVCHILDLPTPFYRKLHKKDEETWSKVCKLFTEDNSKEISLLVSQNNVERIVEGKPPVISPLVKLAQNTRRALEPVKSKIHRLSGNISPDGVKLHIGGSKIEPLKGDIFSAGIELSVNPISYDVLTLSNIERLWCTNMCTLTSKKMGNKISLKDDFKFKCHLIGRTINNLGVRDYMQERIQHISKWRASMAEAYGVFSFIGRLAEDIPGINKMQKEKKNKIPFATWLAKYGKTMNSIKEPRVGFGGSIGDISRQEPWMKTAVTPMPLYKVFNILTYIGSHLDSTHHNDAAAIAIEAGRILEKPADMSSITLNPFGIDFKTRPSELSAELN